MGVFGNLVGVFGIWELGWGIWDLGFGYLLLGNWGMIQMLTNFSAKEVCMSAVSVN